MEMQPIVHRRRRPFQPHRLSPPNGTSRSFPPLTPQRKETDMGRSILLWLLGIPIPIIILLAIFL